MQEFETAVARASAENEEQETGHSFGIVEIGEDEEGNETREVIPCTAYYPGDGALVMLMADTMGRADIGMKLAGIINFLADCLDDESKDYITGRLLDRHDPFGLEEITPIVWWLVEVFGGRPTKQPSDYAPSRKTGGQSSTRRTSKSTSSRSRSTVS